MSENPHAYCPRTGLLTNRCECAQDYPDLTVVLTPEQVAHYRLLDEVRAEAEMEAEYTRSWDPMDDIPAETPDSWIPDNPNEDGFRQADFV